MKNLKKITAAIIAAVIIAAALPCSAAAAEAADVTVSISTAGKITAACETLRVTDLNRNGKIDIDDALLCIHKKHNQKYTSEDSAYGRAITCLWGDQSGSYGYFVNDKMVMTNLDEAISSGDYIAAYSFTDTAGFSDSYAWFDQKIIRQSAGDNGQYTFSLTAKYTGFDENWNTVEYPLTEATVKTGDKVLGTTDKNGEITITLPKGTYTITAEKSGTVIVPPVCRAYIGDSADIDKVNALIKEAALKASTSKTTKKNIKVTVKADSSLIKELKDMGYTVKYKFYRSTKKAAKYTAKVEKDAGINSYINTSGKKGTKYYYKVRVMVYDADSSLVAKSDLKQCSYGTRVWSK